jgi:gliding motility-associated-like protein
LFRLVSIGVFCLTFIVCNLQAQVVIDTVCVGYTNVPYSVDDHPGSTYKWMVDGGVVVSGHSTSSITVNWKKQPGIFRLSVVEQNESKCWGDSVFAYVLVKGNTFKTSYPLEACIHDSVTLKAGGGIWYQWKGGQTDSILRIKLDHDTSLSVIISDTACGLRTDTFSMKIKAVARPVVEFNSEGSEYFKEQSVLFSYSGDPKDKITWDIEKSMRQHFTGPNVNVRFIDTGDAYIKLYSVNILGCKDSTSRLINIKDEQLFFPSAFTPNGDGLNDTFKPGGTGIKTYSLAIYNRWGQKIFETDDLEHGWDGTFNGQTVDTETYLFQCDARGYSGKLYTFNGNITILR